MSDGGEGVGPLHILIELFEETSFIVVVAGAADKLAWFDVDAFDEVADSDGVMQWHSYCLQFPQYWNDAKGCGVAGGSCGVVDVDGGSSGDVDVDGGSCGVVDVDGGSSGDVDGGSCGVVDVACGSSGDVDGGSCGLANVDGGSFCVVVVAGGSCGDVDVVADVVASFCFFNLWLSRFFDLLKAF